MRRAGTHSHSRARRALLLVGVGICGACWDSGMRTTPEPVVPDPVEVALDRPLQKIDGFGASSAWTAPNLNDAMAVGVRRASLAVELAVDPLRIRRG